jgi:hypothetical protein
MPISPPIVVTIASMAKAMAPRTLMALRKQRTIVTTVSKTPANMNNTAGRK